MKKLYALALFVPFFAACSQSDVLEEQTDIPVVKNIKISVADLAFPNEEDGGVTRAWSGETLGWEAPKVKGEYKIGAADIVGLAFCSGYSGIDVSHGGVYGGDPFRSTPYSYSWIGCEGTENESTDMVWNIQGTVRVGECVPFYPYSSFRDTGGTSIPLVFDISNQTLKNKRTQVLSQGCLYLGNGQIGVEAGGTHRDQVTLDISINPVSSLLQLCLDMKEYKASEIDKVEISNVGTGFTYLPQADKAFGFSTEGRVSQKTAKQLISEGYAKDYQEGTITLTGGSIKADQETGLLEIYAWYLPVIGTLTQPTVTLHSSNGDIYKVKALNRDMTTYNSGENLTKFNSGLKMGFSATSPAMEIVKIN